MQRLRASPHLLHPQEGWNGQSQGIESHQNCSSGRLHSMWRSGWGVLQAMSRRLGRAQSSCHQAFSRPLGNSSEYRPGPALPQQEICKVSSSATLLGSRCSAKPVGLGMHTVQVPSEICLPVQGRGLTGLEVSDPVLIAASRSVVPEGEVGQIALPQVWSVDLLKDLQQYILHIWQRRSAV